jgi:hypothetical protein
MENKEIKRTQLGTEVFVLFENGDLLNETQNCLIPYDDIILIDSQFKGNRK